VEDGVTRQPAKKTGDHLVWIHSSTNSRVPVVR
jgi:hypothetical protein